ncbi:hypothetical protein H6G36_00125 [Anabaena minutissima FACHB-250]|nr:hypothetical protein [Anabaena minutissima FACHB-250]
MLKLNRATILLAATLIFAPMVMATPAQAQSRNRHRQVYQRRDSYQRVVRLRNGDYRLPNGRVVTSRRVVRFRNPGYWRLPNGDVILPTQEIVPARRLVRQSNGLIRLPNGITIRL